MPQMKYRGDRVGDYDHGSGTGLIGKVVGPNARGEYFVVTEASYDEATDTTHATAMLLRRPEVVADEMLRDQP